MDMVKARDLLGLYKLCKGTLEEYFFFPRRLYASLRERILRLLAGDAGSTRDNRTERLSARVFLCRYGIHQEKLSP